MVAAILLVLKPALLPFTLGISVVIVGAALAALVESYRWWSSQKPNEGAQEIE